jgi:hypothetical protein
MHDVADLVVDFGEQDLGIGALAQLLGHPLTVRASGTPPATQRSQKPDTISVSAVPARPACVSHADNFAKNGLLMTELYSATNYQENNHAGPHPSA